MNQDLLRKAQACAKHMQHTVDMLASLNPAELTEEETDFLEALVSNYEATHRVFVAALDRKPRRSLTEG